MTQKLSVEEIKAVAESAIAARQAAEAAKQALEDAGGEDETLKSAYESAEQAAKDAQAKAEALSQGPTPPAPDQKKIEKLKRKMNFIKEDLRAAGALDEEEEDEEDDLDDEDRPLTMGDLKRIDARKAAKTALEMANAIEDAGDKAAVVEALKSVVPSGDPQKDFGNAVAIANRVRNSVILEEAGRKVAAPAHTMGAGAPARQQQGDKFEPTLQEQAYMRPPFSLSKEEILAARGTSK